MATIHEALVAAQNYFRAGHYPQAAEVCQRILQVAPTNTDALWFLGLAYQNQGQLEEAVANYQQAISLKSGLAEVHNNLGNALKDLGRVDEAVTNLKEAVRLNPGYANAHQNLGIALLLQGNFAEGWPEYEWRWRRTDITLRYFEKPEWDGSSLEGRTILLHPEQGLGDTLQFIRFAPILKQSGATVVVECQRSLAGLLSSCQGIDHLIAEGTPLPEHDVQAPLLKVPAFVGISLDTIPANVPYLFPDVGLVQEWRAELSGVTGLKVGIIWQGNPEHPGDLRRSFPLTHFAPLARIDGVRLFSLQKGAGSEQVYSVAGKFPVTDLGVKVSWDFQEIAAVVKNLDLVITADTAIAHLAGALGVPVWVTVPISPDWRWLTDREDSPWYPTMRLFRQRAAGDWDDVFGRIAEALQNHLAQKERST